MVVFPFGFSRADEEQIDGAAARLTELNSESLSRSFVWVGGGSKSALKTCNDDECVDAGGIARRVNHPAPGSIEPVCVWLLDSSDDSDTAENDERHLKDEKRASLRSHFITIREEDTDRLEPGEYLNDTLIDFWMQWYVASPHVMVLNRCPHLIRFCLLFFILRIWRKEKHWEDCPVHIFTTHFYTALKESGTKAVTSWTANKKIDIFRKKFILIPVNQGEHWSLCCVVNPGAILNNVMALNKDPGEDKPYPCILFFDSLKAHPTAAIARKVRKWLNSEWKRLDKASNQANQDESNPFTKFSLLVHNPKGEYLDVLYRPAVTVSLNGISCAHVFLFQFRIRTTVGIVAYLYVAMLMRCTQCAIAI